VYQVFVLHNYLISIIFMVDTVMWIGQCSTSLCCP